METKNSETVEIVFSLRLPVELNEKICADAERKRRSRQAHIVFSLEQLFMNAPAAAATTAAGDGVKEKRK